jgi:P4 family phage/plasmid primase-like protien
MSAYSHSATSAAAACIFENAGGSSISFTLFSKDKGILTKRMKLADGRLEKDASECRMNAGQAETITLAPAQFGTFLQGLKSHQAIAHGICGHSKTLIVSKAKESGATTANGLPVIARTNEHFRYSEGPGLLMLDHDKARDNAVALDDKALTAYTPDRLIEIISSFFPEIIHAAHVWACSTSSCIYNTETNEELRGKGAGFHLYLFLKNAVDAPRFLKVLGKRLFLAGYGRVEISRAGSLLERTLADLLVGSPERLDFVAGAVCDKRLEQRRPEPEYHSGGLLDTAKLPDLSTEEEAAYQEIVRQLKEKAQPTQETIKATYLEQEAEKLASSSGGAISLEQARETVRTRQSHVLADVDLLHFGHLKEPVSVALLLEHGPEFNGKSCADPLEPEYNGSRSTAKFYWNDGRNPLVHSFAHGEIKYSFSRFAKPERDDWSFAEVEEILELRPELLKWILCAALDQELSRTQKNAIAQDIIKHNSFTSLELDAVKDMIKKRLGIAKGAQEKVLHETSLAVSGGKIGAFDERTHAELASDFIKRFYPDRKQQIGAEGELWKYNAEKGIFKEIKLNKVEFSIGTAFSGDYCKRGADYKAIARLIYNHLEQPDFFAEAPYGIPTRSCFIRLADDGSIRKEPYTPEHRVRYTLHVDAAETGSPAPLFSQYLEDSFKGSGMNEQIFLLQEIMGGILTGCFSRQQKAVLLYGDGENGKSVLLELLDNMFLPEMKAAIPPEQFDNPYYLAMLAGKFVNIVGEVDKSKPLTATFKDVVGCDTPITARLPYKEPFDFKPRAAHIFSANNFPQSNDHSHGFYRRWIILSFRNVVHPDKKIQNLGAKIAVEEMPQVIAWALQGAERLAKNKHVLTSTSAHEECLNEWKNAKDSVFSFFHDEEEVERTHESSRVPHKTVYNSYTSWCYDNGFKSTGYQEFLKRSGRFIKCNVRFPGEQRSFAGLRLLRQF